MRPTMPIRLHLRSFTTALIVLMQFSPAAASVMNLERPAQIIAAQLHRRGVVCTAPRDPLRDAAAPVPHDTVWTLRCKEASYRVRFIAGGRRVEITPISVGTTVESRSEHGEGRTS